MHVFTSTEELLAFLDSIGFYQTVCVLWRVEGGDVGRYRFRWQGMLHNVERC